MRGLVVGLGSADRGDDAAGLEAANALARLVPEDVAVRSLPGREITLLDHWTDAPLVIVIDAVVSGAVPGTVHIVDVSAGRLRLGTPPGSSHAFGLAEVIELGRALGRLPERLIVVGIEAADCSPCAGLSAPVRAAVPEAVRLALAEVIIMKPWPGSRRPTSPERVTTQCAAAPGKTLAPPSARA